MAARNTCPSKTTRLPLGVAALSRARALRHRRTHVLIVDDNEINLLVAQGFCQVLGFSCEFARDGAQAVAIARGGHFGLILMDICMPGMDGVEATRLIRELPGFAGKGPIIAVTANGDLGAVAGYLAAGMCAVVTKPIEAAKLFAAIERALA